MEPIYITSQKGLAEAVTKAVEDAISRALPEAIQRATAKPYLTKRDLMDLTGWSSRQIEYKKSQRALPFIKRGRLVLFPTQEVYAYLEEGRVPASHAQRNMGSANDDPDAAVQS